MVRPTTTRKPLRTRAGQEGGEMGGPRFIVKFGVSVAILAVGAANVVAGDDPTTHPNPLPLSTIRSGHPRIWFNADNVDLLRQRWNDPAYTDIVNKYQGRGDALSLALEGLATNNASKCSQAAASASYSYRPQGDQEAGFVDSISLVFDWCYNYLDSGQRADLVSKIKNLRNEHLNNPNQGIRNFYFDWHETYLYNTFAYIGTVLAIEGEPGVSSELSNAQNLLQNLQEFADEVSGDGGYRTYFYQGTIQILPFLMWSSATDLDFASRSAFTKNFAKWAVYKLSPTGHGFVRGPADDEASEPGYTNDMLSAGGFYLLASHFDDSVAQWLGDQIRSEFGQTRHWWRVTDGPSFLSLVHYDPHRSAQSPAQAGMSLTRRFNKIGMVHVRSSWSSGPDVIHSWFYNGPAEAHFVEAQNHFTIWRGDDPLIMRGGNYLGTPSVYRQHYGGHTISENSVVFSPAGSGNPDHEGGQSLEFTSQALNASKYPVAARVGSWSYQHRYRGEIAHFEDTSRYTSVSGNTEKVYDPEHVNSYVRDFVYLKPDIFLIRDRFSTTNVSTIRSLIHSRRKPLYDGPTTVVQGSSSAGIIESTGDHFELRNGNSQADVKVLWPANPKLRFVGGQGYESLADGYNPDPWTTCQDWLRNSSALAERIELIEDQWRTEIEVTPSQAQGNLFYAIFVSDTSVDEKPVFSTSREGLDIVVHISRDGETIEMVFPAAGTPFIRSIDNDNLALFADDFSSGTTSNWSFFIS
jgi:hypothetical protein